MAASIPPLDKCLSPHWEMRQKDHVKLVWHEPFEGVRRSRALAWTCDCRAVVYELLQAGGQAFIRKTTQTEPTPGIEESTAGPWRRRAECGMPCSSARCDRQSSPRAAPLTSGGAALAFTTRATPPPPPIAADISGPTEVSMPSSRVRPPTTYTATPHPTRTDGVDTDQGPRTIEQRGRTMNRQSEVTIQKFVIMVA
ncbi:hypothetical protein Mame01_36740 [Microbispora amethystogenes]|nr:hypothetical protein Mame01_36740 [Microbispora amethystogenes]